MIPFQTNLFFVAAICFHDLDRSFASMCKEKNCYMQTEYSLLIIPPSWLQSHGSPGTLILDPQALCIVHM